MDNVNKGAGDIIYYLAAPLCVIEELETLLEKVHGQKIRQIVAGDHTEWNRLLELLGNAKLDFRLVEEVPINQWDVYYIYKRNRMDKEVGR